MDEGSRHRRLSRISKLLPFERWRPNSHEKAAEATPTQEGRCQVSAEVMSRAADGNVFADLSGTSNSTTDNPYDALLEACKQESVSTKLSVRMDGMLIAPETNPASLSDAPRDPQ